jgi:cell division transport system permease protein
MIADWLAAARRELPLGRDESARFVPWVVALLVYVAGLGGVGLLVVAHTLRASGHALATAATLEVPADASNARLATVVALLRQTPGIQSVRLLEPAETARLLEPWFGPAVPLDQLPVPRLIDLRIDPDGKVDLATLRQQLASVAPNSRLDDHLLWPPGMPAAAHRVEGILAASIAMALLMIAASAAFAARAPLVSDRSVPGLLHALGARDADIARGFALRSLWQGLLGGVIGALAALFTIIALRSAGSIVQLPAPVDMDGVSDWRVWAILGGVAPAAGLIAMASAWAAVLHRLHLMP